METTSQMSPRPAQLPKWLPAVVIGAGVLAYANSLSGPFIFDDLHGIKENYHICRLWPLQRAMSGPPQSPVAGRPVVCLSLAINYACCGLDVRGYHAFNLLVHLISALLLLGIVRRTLLSPIFSGRFNRSAPVLATTAATIWMIHPLQTESVTYVIQRTELLMGMFYLLTLYCAIRGWTGPHRRTWFAAAIFSCALGMGSKEVMVSAPLIVLLYDRVFVSGSFVTSLRRYWTLFAGLAATWIILAVIIASGPRSASVGLGFAITPLDYLRTQAGVILHYLRLCAWPHPLVISYTDWPVTRTFAAAWPQGLAILVLLAGTLWALWRRPWLGFLGSWFFLILAPTSSFVPIVTEIVAERRMYLPLAAVVVSAVIGGHRLLRYLLWSLSIRRTSRQRITGVVAIAVAALLGCATAVRNHDYRSALAIWSRTVTDRPANSLAHCQLGSALVDLKRFEEAIDRFTQALRIEPKNGFAHSNLGDALARLGRTHEAIERYKQALSINPKSYKAYSNLGNILADQGKLDEAVKRYRQALKIKPDFADAHNNLGNALADQGKLDEAVKHYKQALKIKPDSAENHNNLGIALIQQGQLGQIDQAIEHFGQALRLRPRFPQAHNNLGLALVRKGQIDQAVEHFTQALRLQPNYTNARVNLANARAKQREH